MEIDMDTKLDQVPAVYCILWL